MRGKPLRLAMLGTSPYRGGMRLPATRRVKAGRPATFGPLPAAPALRRAPCDVGARRAPRGLCVLALCSARVWQHLPHKDYYVVVAIPKRFPRKEKSGLLSLSADHLAQYLHCFMIIQLTQRRVNHKAASNYVSIGQSWTDFAAVFHVLPHFSECGYSSSSCFSGRRIFIRRWGGALTT